MGMRMPETCWAVFKQQTWEVAASGWLMQLKVWWWTDLQTLNQHYPFQNTLWNISSGKCPVALLSIIPPQQYWDYTLIMACLLASFLLNPYQFICYCTTNITLCETKQTTRQIILPLHNDSRIANFQNVAYINYLTWHTTMQCFPSETFK